MRRTLVWTATCTLAGLILFSGLSESEAGGGGMKGQIKILTKMPAQQYYKSQSQFYSFIRRNSTSWVSEDAQDKTWRFNIMAFFKKRLADSEVTLMFYDADPGQSSKYVDSQVKMTKDYNSDSLLCSVTLERPPFDANKKYKIVAQDKDGNALASGTFETRGTSTRAIDSQKRYENTQREMEKSMKDLEQKAKAQEAAEKARKQKDNNKAAKDLF